MHSEMHSPRSQTILLPEALLEMTAKRLGFTTVLNSKDELVGVFSDGDLRRAIEAGAIFEAKESGYNDPRWCDH